MKITLTICSSLFTNFAFNAGSAKLEAGGIHEYLFSHQASSLQPHAKKISP